MANGNGKEMWWNALGKYGIGTVFACALLWIVVEYQIKPSAETRATLIASTTLANNRLADAIEKIESTMLVMVRSDESRNSMQRETLVMMKEFTTAVNDCHTQQTEMLKEIHQRLPDM